MSGHRVNAQGWIGHWGDCFRAEAFPVSRVEIRLRKLNLPFPNNLSYVEVFLARDAPLL
jgi:hypothetical protein